MRKSKKHLCDKEKDKAVYKVQIIFKNGNRLCIEKEFETLLEAGRKADALAEYYRSKNERVYCEKIYLAEGKGKRAEGKMRNDE